MPVTLIQPRNEAGKPIPMCAFDPKNGYIGHDFKNMGHAAEPLIVCGRCGVLWEVSK